MDEDDQNQITQEERETTEAIGRHAERKIKARKEKEHRIWFGLGMFGMVGWAVAVPTLIGVMAGLWLDSHTGSDDGRSWTLTLLLAGVALGCANAWYWVSREGRHD